MPHSIAARTRRTRLAALAVVAALASSSLAPGIANAQSEEGIGVDRNFARVLKLDRAVSKVIIGNPEIADVTVSDPQTIVLTGRNFGVTNLVLIDADGTTLVDERIVVGSDGTNQLKVWRNTNGTVLTCSPTCEEPAAVAGVN